MFDLKKCPTNADGNCIAHTRDGREVRILAINAKAGSHGICSIVGLIKSDSGIEDASYWEANGRSSRHCQHPNDLINVLDKHQMTVILYRYESQYLVRLECEPAPPTWTRLVTQLIEWEE